MSCSLSRSMQCFLVQLLVPCHKQSPSITIKPVFVLLKTRITLLSTLSYQPSDRIAPESTVCVEITSTVVIDACSSTSS